MLHEEVRLHASAGEPHHAAQFAQETLGDLHRQPVQALICGQTIDAILQPRLCEGLLVLYIVDPMSFAKGSACFSLLGRDHTIESTIMRLPNCVRV